MVTSKQIAACIAKYERYLGQAKAFANCDRLVTPRPPVFPVEKSIAEYETILTALRAMQSAGKPVYVVIDEENDPCYVASWPEACHEHINDAINFSDMTEAAKWKVRTYYAAPPQPPVAAMGAHIWDRSGERCSACGDKDWMQSPVCLEAKDYTITLQLKAKDQAHLVEYMDDHNSRRTQVGLNPITDPSDFLLYKVMTDIRTELQTMRANNATASVAKKAQP
jgi:hypothetical protein